MKGVELYNAIVNECDIEDFEDLMGNIELSEDEYIEIIRKLQIETNIDLSMEDDFALECACKYKLFKVADYIMQDPRVNPQFAFEEACEDGDLENVKFF